MAGSLTNLALARDLAQEEVLTDIFSVPMRPCQALPQEQHSKQDESWS